MELSTDSTFDRAPGALIASQKPGWALERPFYTDAALFERELERLFFRQWLFAGHASRIPNAGDYFTYQVGQEPLFLIRGDDGQVRALFNICRHKGSRLCLEDCGTVRKVVCPYHQWVYERDGSLLHARHMPEGFDRSQFNLRPAHVQLYEGLIFVCLADSLPPLPAPPSDWIAPYGLSEAKVAHLASYDVRANWKIVVENFMECYHCGKVHPEYTRVMAGAGSSFLSREEMAAESGLPEDETADERRWTPMISEVNNEDTRSTKDHGESMSAERAAVPGPVPTPQSSHPGLSNIRSRPLSPGGSNGPHLRSSASICGSPNPPLPRLPFRRGACTQSLDGLPVAPLMGTHRDYDGAMIGFWIGWTVEFEANPDHVCAFRFTPLEVERTDVQVSWLVRGDAVEGVDYDRQRLIEFWKITGEQDWRICEVVQTGVRSRHYTPGPLSSGERFAAAFLKEYLEGLAAGG